ncbi:MAG: neutral/alkaline non-lysosomal ceramidase N-terminal domain-containing protein [Armatimonadetes bacterium]|nr:neutral/alkaline non-lysosomal ceramidase N-terminal domain-containing protein [Armatimonadota bacterium]
MLLGTGRAVITPPVGTFLAGFGSRDHGSEGVLDDIEARVLWFQEGEYPAEAVCIVTADLIGFQSPLSEMLHADIREKYGLPDERVLLSASHTHSGPQTTDNMIGVGGAADPAVIETIRQRIMEAVASAQSGPVPVSLSAGRGKCEGYAINRRVRQGNTTVMAANPDGVRDDEVLALACRDEAGRLRAVLFRFTCHPTLMGEYLVSGDYPAAARRVIEKSLGGEAVAAFLPGCFGDVRPNCTLIGGNRFRKGTPDDLAVYGEALGGEVVRIVEGEMEAVAPCLDACKITVDLPLARVPDREELLRLRESGTPVQKQLAASLLGRPAAPARPFILQRIDLAKEVTLIAMGGEICCDYGYFVKSLRPDRYMVPVGYSNGIVGYIPSARMFPEGGYEPAESCIYFSLPSPFSPEIEKVIHEGIRGLMES